jgi:hypothetical protein
MRTISEKQQVTAHFLKVSKNMNSVSLGIYRQSNVTTKRLQHFFPFTEINCAQKR